MFMVCYACDRIICGVRARVEMSSGMTRRNGGGDRDRGGRGGGWRRDDYDDRRGGRRNDRYVAWASVC